MAKYEIKCVLRKKQGVAPIHTSCAVDAKSESEALAIGRKKIESMNPSHFRNGFTIDTIYATPK